MEFIVRIEARLAGRVLKTCDVATIARPGVLIGEEELGLSPEDGKEILRELQSRVIAVQVEMLEAAGSLCIHCGRRKHIKDRRPRQFRTVFGMVRVRCRRFIFCTCRGGKARSEWLPEVLYPQHRSTPRQPRSPARNRGQDSKSRARSTASHRSEDAVCRRPRALWFDLIHPSQRSAKQAARTPAASSPPASFFPP
jgi:hypothetical protein